MAKVNEIISISISLRRLGQKIRSRFVIRKNVSPAYRASE